MSILTLSPNRTKTATSNIFDIISDDLIHRILDEAKRILSEVGIEVRGKKLRERMLDCGLSTDESGQRILFSPDVVEKAIVDTPSTFTLYDRNGDPYTELSDN